MVNRLTRDRAAAKPERPQRSTRFIYKERTADQIKRRADNAGGRFDSIFKSGFDPYRPKAGESAIRILPPTWDNHEHFGYDIWVHKYVGPDESNYLCLMKMKSKPCAWCDAAKDAKDAGDTDEYKKLSAKSDVIYWVIDRDDDTPHPQLWHVSGMADGEISDLGRSKRSGKTYYLDHPDQGWDILVDKKGAKLRTRYTYKRDADAGPIPISAKQKKQDEILQFILENPLPSVLKYYDNAYLEKLVGGGVHEQDEDLDDEPQRKPRRGGKKQEEEEVDEDAETEDAEAEEDGDADERPRGRSRRASRDDGDDNGDEAYHEGEADEDGEGEPDGEEDDEPEPRRGRAGGRRPRDEDDEGEDADNTDSNEESEEDPDERPRGRSRKPSRRTRRSEEDDDSNGEEGEETGEEDPGEEDEGETRTTRTSSRRPTSRRQEAKPERGRRVASRRR